MDYYHSGSSSSDSNNTSSNHASIASSHHQRTIPSNNSNNNSSSTHSSSNGGAAYNIEYCTSSSSLSPFVTASLSCPSSAAKTIIGVDVVDMFMPTSSVEQRSDFRHSPASIVSSSSSSSSLSMSHMCSSSQLNLAKRKRRSTISLDEKDPEIDFEPPSAKRQQRLPSIYQSESESVASSVYASPDDILEHDIDTCSQRSESFGIEYNIAAVDRRTELHDLPDIHESPHSLNIDCGVNDRDEVTDDDEVVSGTESPSASSTASASSLPTYMTLETVAQTYVAHHGERTPGQKHSYVLSAMTNSSTSATSAAATTSAKKASPTAGDVMTPSFDEFANAHYNCMTPAEEAEPLRQCPLPALSWANAEDVWQLMCKKDEMAAEQRNAVMLEQHPGLQPRMRAILLDWLIEVCEVYKLHRETYYLAVDYLDRYLSAQKKVQKTHLQLIGITCLFIAAKVEEIYPPKITEFAYVTDGACQEADILQHEILVLQALNWCISPVTPMGWLGVYMQLNVSNRTPASFSGAAAAMQRKAYGVAATEVDEAFIFPQFSGMEYVQTAQLLDLCSLDVGIGQFKYSVIAAAAMSHTFARETALRCSGLDWTSIEACSRWMEPYFQVIREEANYLVLTEQNEQVPSKFGLGHICPNINTDDSHIIQTHTTTMMMFDRASLFQSQYLAAKAKQEASPATGLICPTGLLTPPSSMRKPDGADDEEPDGATHKSDIKAEHKPSLERRRGITTAHIDNAGPSAAAMSRVVECGQGKL